jgi:hypothetical protein
VRIPSRPRSSAVNAHGSRLLVLLDVNKNSIAPVNYGTGHDVSDDPLPTPTSSAGTLAHRQL